MITVITPSIRSEMLSIVGKCLKRQTFTDYEWLIGAPEKLFFPIDREIGHDYKYTFIAEPDKRKGDYYNLNKCWNRLISKAKGELIVSIVDGLWFPPSTLETLWSHYKSNPKAIVGAVGNQYDQLLNGKPEHMVWRDPRMRTDQGSFYEVESTEVEWCIASIPKKAFLEIGGIDEKYDQGAALSEKEANLRMQHAGYKLYLDQNLEYRAIHHPRLSIDWDEKYKIACDMYAKDVHNIIQGKKQVLDYLDK